MAQEQFDDDASGAGRFDLDALGNLYDGSAMGESIQNALKDPEMMKLMTEMGSNIGGALDELSKMTPEELETQMKAAMGMLQDGDVMKQILNNKDEMIKNLETSGMIDEKTLQEFKENPDKLEEDMTAAFSQMMDVFSDPKQLDAATDIATQLIDTLKNPEKLMNSFDEWADIMKNELNDDDKIEEARLQLIDNPELAGSEDLAAVFGSEEMKELLNDPIKWRESVKKGQGMLLAGQGAAQM